jgi:ABC-type uncharacterized transport system permease subunit
MEASSVTAPAQGMNLGRGIRSFLGKYGLIIVLLILPVRYGILELINFAHGDVFMIGGMVTATVVINIFELDSKPSFGSLLPVILISLAAAMIVCGLLNATIERVAYKPLRGAPRLVPLITAIGVAFIIENVAFIWKGPRPVQLPPNTLPHDAIFTIGTCPKCASFRWDQLFVVLVTVPVLLGLVWLVRYTRQGKAMRATAQDKDAAAMMGIDVNRTVSFTFLVAGALAVEAEAAERAPPRPRDAGPELLAAHRQPPSGVCSPRRPCGRKTRMRIRIEKTIDSVQLLPGVCQVSPSLNAWMKPISSAPTTAPGRLPMPPSTAAVNAISPSVKPVS